LLGNKRQQGAFEKLLDIEIFTNFGETFSDKAALEHQPLPNLGIKSNVSGHL
jgi:hypothetical protein